MVSSYQKHENNKFSNAFLHFVNILAAHLLFQSQQTWFWNYSKLKKHLNLSENSRSRRETVSSLMRNVWFWGRNLWWTVSRYRTSVSKRQQPAEKQTAEEFVLGGSHEDSVTLELWLEPRTPQGASAVYLFVLWRRGGRDPRGGREINLEVEKWETGRRKNKEEDQVLFSGLLWWNNK